MVKKATTKKDRTTSVSSEDILRAYIPAQKEGKRIEEIAGILGMKKDSLNTRLCALRRDLFNGTSTFNIGSKDEPVLMRGEEIAQKEGKAVAALSVKGFFKDLTVTTEGYRLPSLLRAQQSVSSLVDIANSL